MGAEAFEQDLRRRIRARGMLDTIESLVGIGDRFVGSDGDRTAAELVRGNFRGWGLALEEREFTTLGYSHNRCELHLLRGETFEAIPPYFSPPTSPEGVRGELVFVGGGDEADYDGLDVAGKIAVIQETGLGYARFWMGTFAAIAARKGAVGVVVIHPLPWPYRMSTGGREREAREPLLRGAAAHCLRLRDRRSAPDARDRRGRRQCPDRRRVGDARRDELERERCAPGERVARRTHPRPCPPGSRHLPRRERQRQRARARCSRWQARSPAQSRAARSSSSARRPRRA